MKADRAPVVGVDACTAGWVAVVLRADTLPTAHVLRSIDELTAVAPGAAVVGIDIPIGLLTDRLRQADLLARTFVGPRRASVFVTPVRPALEARDHATASAINRQATGAGISQQAFGLRHKILQVDRWLSQAACPVHEVHPEVAFSVMLGHPPTATKKSWHGVVERQAALATAGIDLSTIAAEVGAAVGVDDLLDAAAVAWSADRIAGGLARSFPDPPELEPDGREVAIWA